MSRSLRVVLVLLVLSIIAWIVSGREIYARLVYLWTFLIAGSWLWARSVLKNIRFRRVALAERGQVGQVFSEQFEIKNTGKLPILWLDISDGSELPGASGSRVLTLIGGRQTRSFFSRNRLLQRGIYSLGPTTLIGGDVFGLFRESIIIPESQSLLVLPSMVDIQEFPHPPGLLPGGEALHRKTPQITTNAAGVREYAPGDSWSRIHWVSSARRDQLMVKEFELDPRADVWLFIDGEKDTQASLPFTWASVKSGPLWEFFTEVDTQPSTEEYAVNIAASLSNYFLDRGRAVGVVENGSPVNIVAPDRGPRQLGKILQTLASFRATGELPFPGTVSNHARFIPRGSTMIMITPSIEKSLTLCVDQISRLGLRPLVVLLDSVSFGGSVGSIELGKSIKLLGVPVLRVENGDNLGKVLSKMTVDTQIRIPQNRLALDQVMI